MQQIFSKKISFVNFLLRDRHFGLGLGGFWVLGLTNSEFNSVHFGVEIKKKKLLSAKNLSGLKKFRNFLKNFFFIFLKYFRPKKFAYITIRDTRHARKKL